MRSLSTSLFLVAGLSACGSHGASVRRIDIAGAATASAEDQAVIEKRLDDGESLLALFHAPDRPSFSSRDGQVDIRASGTSASDQDLRFLLGHQGLFGIGNEGGRAWLDQGDVVDAQVGLDGHGRPMLRLKLTPDGTLRLAERSAAAASEGTRLVVTLDGETLSTATLIAPITNGALAVATPRSIPDLTLIARIVRSGKLSFKPGDVKVAADPSAP